MKLKNQGTELTLPRPNELSEKPIFEIIYVKPVAVAYAELEPLIFDVVQFVPYPKYYIYFAEREIASAESLESAGPLIIEWLSVQTETESPLLPIIPALSRVWAMPSKHTFTIKPINRLLHQYLDLSKTWIDPFAGENSPVVETNDINPDKPTKYHMEAEAFVRQFIAIDGAIFDPPYSPRQIKEAYESAGLEIGMKETQGYGRVKNAIAERMTLGGIVVSCGWDGNGMGKSRGFELLETLLVPHGGNHNATIVVVERKIELHKAKSDLTKIKVFTVQGKK
jgi:hypothetical protein